MKLTVARFSLAMNLLLAAAAPAPAAVITANSGSFADVSAAVAGAHAGDTVVIPPGTNTWTAVLNFGGITLQGSGVGQTAIVDETPPVGNGTSLLQLNVNSNTLTRLTGVQFLRGVNNTYPFQNYDGEVQVYGQAPLWRIDHCQFTYLTGKSIRVGDGSYGLIDHNNFLMFQVANALEIFDTGFGDNSWASPVSYGSSNAVYVEDNYFFSADNFCAVDISNGGRCVMRHNNLVGVYFNTHGTETSQRYRSDRYVEVYNNTFNFGGGQQYNDFYTGCDIRGGSGVIFSNTFNGFWSTVNLHYYRATDNDPNFIPFFGATGLRSWDSNSPALLTGNAGIASNLLAVAGANWVSNQWYGCTVYNYSNQLCGIVAGNNSNTMTFAASRNASLQLTFNVGDPFVVHKVYPQLDQPGMGTGDLLSGGGPTPVWLHEAADPIYVWSNSLAIMYATLTPAPAAAITTYPNIQLNRDYFNDLPRPGYTPFTYPHPLTLLTNAISTANSLSAPPTNSVSTTNALPAPTGLSVQPI